MELLSNIERQARHFLSVLESGGEQSSRPAAASSSSAATNPSSFSTFLQAQEQDETASRVLAKLIVDIAGCVKRFIVYFPIFLPA
jgi:hypothetical protein